jgi:uncharacterized protein with HEPN domain
VKDDRLYLEHILECLDAIREYVAGGRDIFLADRKTRKATIRELQELAESSQRISPALKDRHPEVPWTAVSGFRNVLVHDYLGLGSDRIWEIIERDLPPFRAAVEEMLRDMRGDR